MMEMEDACRVPPNLVYW